MRFRTSLLLALVLSLFLVSAGSPAGAAVPVDSARLDPIPADPAADEPVEPPTPAAGAFRALPPVRILDSRVGLGAAGPIQANGVITVQVSGREGVPLGGVLAVALNITVTQPTTAGYVQVWASGSPPPNTSNLNFTAGATIANMAIVPLGPDGAIRLFVGSGGPSQVLADLAGYYVAGVAMDAGAYAAVAPTRLVDTRVALGATRLGPNETATVRIAGVDPVPAEVGAVALNVAVTQPSAAGYLQVWPGGTPQPRTSNLNFGARQTVPNLVIVPVGADGTLQISNGSAGTVEVIADVAGFYLAGAATRSGTFAPVSPARLLDTRRSLGAAGPVGPRSEVTVQITGRGGVPVDGAAAVALNVTVTRPSDFGYIQAYPGGTPPPTGSSLNFVAGQTVPNLVVVPLGADGTVTLFNGSAGTVQLIADVYGYVLS